MEKVTAETYLLNIKTIKPNTNLLNPLADLFSTSIHHSSVLHAQQSLPRYQKQRQPLERAVASKCAVADQKLRGKEYFL